MYDVSNKFKEHVKNNGYIEKSARKAVDEVARIKWSDFVLEPLKPNLIENGWDDFEPYGGDVLLEAYNIESPENSGNSIFHVEAESGQTIYIYREIRFKNAKPTENPLLTLIYEDDSKQYLNLDYLEDNIRLSDDTFMYVYKVELKKNLKKVESYKDYNWASSVKIDAIIKKIVVGTIVVIKTPLGNGLTRIQTWGGNHSVKLSSPTGLKNDKTYNSSIYIENIGECDLWIENNGYGLNEKVEKGVKAYIEKTGTGSGNTYLYFAIKTYDVNQNLDFIASDPVIVEGDVPNPVLIVTPLEDGRSHVRIFGATPETKLVHRSTKGFAGEPYTLSTEIENEGLQLQMDTNLSEQSETIRKGDNQVNIEGNLEGNNIEIKLGTE